MTNTDMEVLMTTTRKHLNRMLKVPRIKQNLNRAVAKVPACQKVIIKLTTKVSSNGSATDTTHKQLGEDNELNDNKIKATSLVSAKRDTIFLGRIGLLKKFLLSFDFLKF